MHQDKPTATKPIFLQGRAAARCALPEVDVVMGQQEEQAGSNGKRTAPSEAGSTDEEDEERCAMLAFVVKMLNEQLFIELMQGFHVYRRR
jgi:hypothetical protein